LEAANPGSDKIRPQALTASSAGQANVGPATYDDALARLSASIDTAKVEAAAASNEWLRHEVLARRYIARAKLTGSYHDYAAAQAELDQAFRLAAPGTGPHLTQAQLHFTMHRLAKAEQSLDQIDRYAVPPDAAERAEVAAMRGDIAFYQGRYAEALQLYEEADRVVPGTSDFRRAVFAAKTDAQRRLTRTSRSSERG
jgi:tetratricopeptide (TPR) repeat protein